ncbi:unnamed protein product [Symbiodinium necroappetens]|uniref:Uncharacterized protein n=1 Tax=Symbiodinium necroappetens TaxID=1628268 RepID=A0A812RI96_9DINO|nr:unnamed protein product [Symbiodinium necroappetens]
MTGPETSLDTLALNCSLAPESQTRLLAEGLNHLEELRFLFDNEEHVGSWVAKLGLGDKTILETSRLRRAWAAIRLHFSTSEQDHSKVALTDLDTMLEDAEFIPRTRCCPESLGSFPNGCFVFLPLYFQLTTVQRKHKLGDNLYTEEIETETEESISKDVETYLDKLYTLLLAYAMAGVHPLPGVDVSKEAVLIAKDMEERSEWVTRFREGGLGEAQATGTGTTASQAALQVSHFREGPKVGGKRVAAVLMGAHKCGVIVRNQRACSGSDAEPAEASADAPPLMDGPYVTCGCTAQSFPGSVPWDFQSELRSSLDQACLQLAALDCSTNIREIPLKFESGRPAPRPLRSHEHPMGLPGLNISDQRRVSKDNCACKFVLDEQQKILERGGGAIRENPSNILHWCIPQKRRCGSPASGGMRDMMPGPEMLYHTQWQRTAVGQQVTAREQGCLRDRRQGLMGAIKELKRRWAGVDTCLRARQQPQLRKDAASGFCTEPMRHAELLRVVTGLPFRLIPRCVITQSSGKQRVIDNADAGGQSALSSDPNKLVLCSPPPPSPPRCCVVAWWHAEWGEPAFQLYTGLLFGLALAVTSFNRCSRAVEALGRRLLAILVPMYFDDAHLTDWASLKGSAQASFASLNSCLGSPFADAKRQQMASTGTVQDLIEQAVQTQSLPPGLAAKIYGACNFLEQGMYGRVAAGGLRAIRERADEGGRELTPPIHSCFALIRAVLAARPEREFDILPRVWPRFLAASDAAEDDPGQGSGGFHLVWLDEPEVRESFVAAIGPEVYECFTPGDQKIAQLELATLAVRAPSFRGRRGFWYIDNVAALMSLIRGRSSSPDLERLAQLIHLAMFALRTSFFFEYIPSKTNWADAVGRVGFADPWLHQRGFTCHVACFPFQLVDLPFLAVLRVFEFL